MPQWSPLVVSGMTGRSAPPSLRATEQAAMEPARGERDDTLMSGSSRRRADLPQWSPLVVSGMTMCGKGLHAWVPEPNAARSW